MGMFDSIYDVHGVEWQTKALECLLHRYHIGDRIPQSIGGSCQIEVLNEEVGLATIKNGTLVEVPSQRDPSLPLIDYYGDVTDLGSPLTPIMDGDSTDLSDWRNRLARHLDGTEPGDPERLLAEFDQMLTAYVDSVRQEDRENTVLDAEVAISNLRPRWFDLLFRPKTRVRDSILWEAQQAVSQLRRSEDHE